MLFYHDTFSLFAMPISMLKIRLHAARYADAFATLPLRRCCRAIFAMILLAAAFELDACRCHYLMLIALPLILPLLYYATYLILLLMPCAAAMLMLRLMLSPLLIRYATLRQPLIRCHVMP